MKLSGFAEINTGRLQLKIRSRATADMAVRRVIVFLLFFLLCKCARALSSRADIARAGLCGRVQIFLLRRQHIVCRVISGRAYHGVAATVAAMYVIA